ncbi:MAG: mycofactocin biosynthesis chaperone MftB [Ilumatobacter sp.]|uniref:mycofactocin biosynthesis chaperone MftB n=1 Tax=Ilumatobacter sp. TaxID=1967498 RepID=UPI0026319CA1|nr:mycofactocin biosynthesis chaperone MftB [Ilumatobacter sp.]MDJ0771178.1 mycofactocin biosynthesis chaperone MftB [Ilumatobacter sp.]
MNVHSDARLLGRSLRLHPQVALRPEPFGALAYHYDTRRLVFLKDPDVVRVVTELEHHATVAATLDACRIAPQRRGSFERALQTLIESEMLDDRAG